MATADYKSIAKKLKFEGRAYINGKYVDAIDGDKFENINPATGETLEENPDMLKNGEVAIVKIMPTKPLVLEKNSEIPQMSRFAIRDAGQTVAAGMCMDLIKKD